MATIGCQATQKINLQNLMLSGCVFVRVSVCDALWGVFALKSFVCLVIVLTVHVCVCTALICRYYH